MINVDSERAGKDVKIEGGRVVSGHGAALASEPLEQDASYWEVQCAGSEPLGRRSLQTLQVHVVNEGNFCIGVAKDLFDHELALVRSMHGSCIPRVRTHFLLPACAIQPLGDQHNSWSLSSTAPGMSFQAGDVLACTFGQSDLPMLSFYKVRGRVLYVSAGLPCAVSWWPAGVRA
jgi:hypothetical protein